MDFEGNTVTGIETTRGNVSTDNVCYDLTGRRIARPTRGLYIINGKKMVIK
jgi:hypothetical protein